MSFKFREKGAQFPTKLLKKFDIAPLGLFLASVLYVIDKKYVNSIGFVSRPSPFPLAAIGGFRFHVGSILDHGLMTCESRESRITNPDLERPSVVATNEVSTAKL